MSGLFNLLAGLLSFFYDVVPSLGIAIIGLTLVVKLALAPVTLKGTRSMLALQRLQPEMKRLQEKHKNDRQALNEAMMAFYKEHQVNPVAGCLPMLLQMPVLFVMFQVISGLTRKGSPKYISESSGLYEALVEQGQEIKSFGIHLARTASQASGVDALPLYLLIALVVITGYYQIAQTTARNQKSGAPVAVNPQMKMMSRVFPLFSGLISLSLPGGVVLYFLVSNLAQITQQSLMYRFDPVLKATVRREVREVDTKATEIEHEHQKGMSKPAKNKPAPSSTNGVAKPASTGRVTPPGGSGRNRSKKKRSRRGK